MVKVPVLKGSCIKRGKRQRKDINGWRWIITRTMHTRGAREWLKLPSYLSRGSVSDFHLSSFYRKGELEFNIQGRGRGPSHKVHFLCVPKKSCPSPWLLLPSPALLTSLFTLAASGEFPQCGRTDSQKDTMRATSCLIETNSLSLFLYRS